MDKLNEMTRKLATEGTGETSALLYTIYINLFIFGLLICSFEAFRHFKQIYLKRMKRKFEATNRVPPRPPSYFLGWLRHVYMIPQEEFLHMVGLDGYMLIRFIILCFKLSCFVTFWGVTILAPLYYHAQGGTLSEWNGYTLANVVDGYGGIKLWLPAIFSYLYMAYACHLFYSEYRHFVLKRLEYLIQGDPDTNPQTHYTVMIENVPATLQSGPALKDFFEKLFPGNVFSVEIMLELKQLESICDHRSGTRNKLEKAIAVLHSTSKRSTITITKSYFLQIKEDLEKFITKITTDSMSQIVEQGDNNKNGYNLNDDEHDGRHSLSYNPNESRNYLRKLLPSSIESPENCAGCVSIDAITYYACMLDKENEVVRELQEELTRKTEEIAAAESEKIKQQYADTRSGTFIAYIQEKSAEGIESAKNDIAKRISLPFISKKKRTGSWISNLKEPLWSPEESDGTPPSLSPSESPNINKSSTKKLQSIDIPENLERSPSPGSPVIEKGMQGAKAIILTGKQIVGDAATVAGSSLNEFANESVRTARIAGRGAIRSILEATRTLELLTLGAYYSTSSTAFVTFKSRVAKSVAYQMLLSHENYQMVVTSAPNAKDIRWENVSIPLSQINARHQIAGMTFGILAIFWSAVVALIKAYSSLDDLAENYKWLEEYQNSLLYKLLNEYLAVVVLLILLALLPFVFDFVARFYEGLKCESEIQDLIMTRYFYYQLANVYVTVTAGTIFGSINDIIQHPGNILTILGKSLPQVSIYFANMLVVKTLTGVPVEMLRIWQLLTVLGVRSFWDKNKFTRRELRTGVFMDYPMEYGWVYPNLLMVLMILTIYMCIAPLLMPCAVMYFAFAYAMYKYQLLYVFVNDYQSGGNMWYQVFNRSMIILIGASLVLWGYLGLKRTYHIGPFYMMIPQPFLLYYFWDFCNKKFTTPSIAMSLECSVEMDGLNSGLKNLNKQTPVDLFDPKLYRQKALIVEDLVPERYRNYTHEDIISPTSSPIISSHPVGSGISNNNSNNNTDLGGIPPSVSVSASAAASGSGSASHPNLIISPSFKRSIAGSDKSRQESIEGVTMMEINNYSRAPSLVGRQTFDEHSPTSYRAASVDQERELSIAMEKFDSDNLEDQIDELLAPTKPSSKSLSDIRSSTSKLLAEEAPTYGTLNERKGSFVTYREKK